MTRSSRSDRPRASSSRPWRAARLWRKRYDEPGTDHAGWLRNPDRKPWSFKVPYDFDGVPHAMFPDLLFLRRLGDGSLGVDLIDPHAPTLADAPAKAVGLARYAALYGHHFERIEMTALDHEVIKTLNLKDADTRNRVLKVTTNPHLVALFEGV